MRLKLFRERMRRTWSAISSGLKALSARVTSFAPSLRGFFRDTRLVWEMGLGAVLAVLLAFSATKLVWIARNVAGHRHALIISILAASYGLYLVRRFSRIAYGTLEIVVGMLIIVSTIGRATGGVDDSLLMVQLAAGMYVIIRGFDNFSQSEPFAGGGKAFNELWKLIRKKLRHSAD